ncbi:MULTISPECIES: hypothetical protein [unclassified Wolbachia]|uniref:hypothetical protein n=1 Tax=unclassified Wolbachia TaxID=2640676 RepID=UPI0022305BB4|nr:hypothetical protein [Wolbachia endosymbiont (group A) of Apoderus coryli]
MLGIIYLAILGIAVVIGAIVSILTGLALSTLTSLSPLMIGGIVGAISVAPLIVTFIKAPLSNNDRRVSDLTLKEIACLAGLFIGSVAVGVGLGSVAPIVKVNSLSSLSTTMNSLLMIGVTAPVLPIVAAIGIAIALDKIKRLMKSSEKEPSRLTEEELQNLSNELKEISCNKVRKTTANSPQ